MSYCINETRNNTNKVLYIKKGRYGRIANETPIQKKPKQHRNYHLEVTVRPSTMSKVHTT